MFPILAAACACAASAAEPLPKVWMSTQWRDPFEDTIRACAEQGVDVVEVPTWTTNHCAYSLSLLRKYKVKGAPQEVFRRNRCAYCVPERKMIK